jgi:hypothetical protein
MIVASFFGTPAGLEVHRNPIGEATSIKIEDDWIDSLSEDVKLTSDSDVFYIYRRVEAGQLLTWVGVYRFAAEMGAGRPGGFYGAGLWLINSVISSSAIYEVVINLANQIRDQALKEGKFVKRIADIRGAITPPPQVATLLDGSARVTTGGLAVGKGDRAFISDQKNIIAIIDWAQKDVSADFFSHVIVAAPGQYVEQKSQFSNKFERFESIQVAKEHAYRRRIAIQNAEQRKSEIALAKSNEDQRKQALTFTELNKKIISYEAEAKTSRAALAKAESTLLTLQKKIAADKARNLGEGGNVAESETRHQSVFYLGTCIAFLIVEIFLAIFGYFYVDQLIDKATTPKQKEIERLNKDIVELNKRIPLYAYEKLVEDLKGLKGQNEVLIQQNQKLAHSSSAEARSSENPKDGSEPSCDVDFQKINYRILLDTNSSGMPKDEPKRVEVFNKIAEKCGIAPSDARCKQTLGKIRNMFIENIRKLDGQLWLPMSCEVNIKEKNYAIELRK